MSATQAKATPSKAARELAKALFPDFTPEIHVGYADIIQAHVSELLEKAEAFRAQNYNRIGVREFAKALEPWKPGE